MHLREAGPGVDGHPTKNNTLPVKHETDRHAHAQTEEGVLFNRQGWSISRKAQHNFCKAAPAVHAPRFQSSQDGGHDDVSKFHRAKTLQILNGAGTGKSKIMHDIGII